LKQTAARRVRGVAASTPCRLAAARHASPCLHDMPPRNASSHPSRAWRSQGTKSKMEARGRRSSSTCHSTWKRAPRGRSSGQSLHSISPLVCPRHPHFPFARAWRMRALSERVAPPCARVWKSAWWSARAHNGGVRVCDLRGGVMQVSSRGHTYTPVGSHVQEFSRIHIMLGVMGVFSGSR
jgi:hypothetical protein